MQLYGGMTLVIALLRYEGRITYEALKDEFGLDDVFLDKVRRELLFKQLAIDEDGKGLVWIGDAEPAMQPVVATPSQPAVPKGITVVSAATPTLPMDVTETDTPSNGPIPPPETLSTDVPLAEPITVPEPIRRGPDAERRQLTVMFCDLVGSTDLSSKLDPEDLREVVRAYQETAAEVIQRYEGHIAQYLGDGLLIYFGFPVAHEDDAQRAVHTGLGIPEAMAVLNVRLQTDYSVQLAVRIGIHTGPAVVGEMGGGGRHEKLALGETPNIAARLEGLAQANTAVISPTTAQLVQRSFVLEDLGPHELKGVGEPMMLYAAVAPREAGQDDHESRLTGGLDALVGRDEEIGLLMRRWEQSKEGLGQAALISGDAGIGKSRLVDCLRDTVRQARLTQIVYRCSPYHTNSALYPVITHLEHLLGFEHGDSVVTKLDKLEQGLRASGLPLEEMVPPLAVLLSVPLEERYPAPSLSPQQQKQQTMDALTAWLGEEADRQPVLAVWEDVHWADPSTLEVLGMLIEQAPTMPILHVLTFRPEFSPPWPTRSHMTPITLNRLDRPQSEALITQLLDGKSLPSEVIEHIITKTDGVPLYVEELTKMLLASDLLRQETDKFVLTGPLMSMAIPDTLQDSLMARLDQMNTAKEVAQLGAVLGREFRYDVIQATALQDEESLQAGLTQLVEAELLYQRGRLPRSRYIFKHALIQDAAYASLLKSTRQQVHQRIAQVFEARFPETVETQPELLAHHYMEAKLFDQATHYWYKAGQREAAGSANREAIACFEQALVVIKRLPKNREQIEQELALQLALRETLFPLKEFDRALACLQEAEKLAETLDDHHSLGSILCYQGLHLWAVNNDHAQALSVCERALQIAATQQDVVLLALARDNLGRPHVYQGAYAQAMEIYDQNIDLLVGDLQYERFGMALFLSVSARCFYSHCCAEVGLFAEGQHRIDEAIRIAEAKDHPHSLIRAHYVSGCLALRQGSLSYAIEALERAMMICREVDIPLLLLRPMSYLGAAYALMGRISEALDLQEKALEQHDTNEAMMQVLMGETYLLSNRLEEAQVCANRALMLARAHNERAYQAWGLRLYGAVVHQGDAAEMTQSKALYQEALKLAEELRMRPLQAHCHRCLGTMYNQTGQVEQARAELSTAIDMYRDMEMTFWLPETEAALTQVE